MRATLFAAATLTVLATAQAQEPSRVAEADHIDGWHGLFGWRSFPLRLPGGALEVCIDAHWQIGSDAEPNTYFELRCESGISERLNYTILDGCQSPERLDPDPITLLELPPEGDVCDLQDVPPIREENRRFHRHHTYIYWRYAACARAADRVCLAGDYAVAVDYMDSAGNWVRGAPQKKLSESAAVFYFFDPNNAEVLVKLLDACGLTGHRWLYSAPATDLAYRVTVYTPVDGVPHVWTANAGSGAADTRFTSVWAITDTEAFRCGEEP